MDSNDTDLSSRRKQVLGRLFVRTSKTIQARNTDEIRDRGFAEYRLGDNPVIIHLEVAGNRISRIAQRSGLTKQAVSQLVTDLEKRGFVAKHPDPTDGRAQIVKFTDNGMNLLKVGVDVVEETDQQIIDLLGEERAEQLRSALEEILEHFDPDGF